MLVEPEAASIFWIRVFLLFCYGLTLGCLYHAIRVGLLEYKEALDLGYPRSARVLAGLSQVLFFAGFALLFWALESWAHFRTPFYVYDQYFPDLIPRIDFEWLLGGEWRPLYQDCSRAVCLLMEKEANYRKIPMAIPLLEASLTYAAMWIAILLGAGFRLAPFLAALLMLNVDAILDPVVAVGHRCDGSVRESAGPGLRLWHWYHPENGAEDAGPILKTVDSSGKCESEDPPADSSYPNASDGSDGIAEWFGVPLFNYAAWWAAPVAFISIVMVIQYFRGRFWPRRRGRPERANTPTGIDALILGPIGAVVLAVFVMILMAPNKATTFGEVGQWTALTVVVLLTVAWLSYRVWKRDLTSHDRPDPSVTRPIYFFILLGIGALLLEGVFLEIPGLILVGVFTLLVGGLLTWWPYPTAVRAFFQRLTDVDRFMRIHYMGFAFLLALLGAFALGLQNTSTTKGTIVYELLLTKWQLASLLGIAILYHIWGFVLNDVIDLPIDVEQGKRSLDPLVQGRIDRGQAFAIAMLSVPGAFMLTFLMQAPGQAYLILILGMLLMAAYNLWGKRCPIPPLTDLVQASAWALLAIFAANAVAPGVVEELVNKKIDPPVIGGEHWWLVWAIASWGGGFILLINGIHGGLRDLANDADFEATTTAIWLGARVDPETGGAISNWRIVAFAYLVHLAMFIMPTLVLFSDLKLGEWRTSVMLALYGLGGVSLVVLWFVVKPREPNRDRWITRHLPIVLLPAVVAFLPFLDLRAGNVLLVAFFLPLLAQRGIVHRFLKLIHPQIADDAIQPPGTVQGRPPGVK